MSTPVSHAKTYNSDYQYYRNATMSIVTAVAIGALVLLHLHQWNVERCVVRCKLFLTNFFATDLTYKIAAVAGATIVAVASPYGVAALLIHSRDHLKMDHLYTIPIPENADGDALAQIKKLNSLIEKIICHNQRLLPVNSTALKKEIRKLNDQELTTILHALAEIMINDKEILNIEKVFDKLSEVIDWRAKDIDIERLPEIIENAENYFHAMDNKYKMSFVRYLCRLKDSLLISLDNIIGILGVADLAAPTDNDTQQSFKGQKLFVLATILQILTTILVQSLGGRQGGIVVGSIFGSVIGISAIWSYIRPLPSELPGGAINLTREVEEGRIRMFDTRPGVGPKIGRHLDNGEHVLMKSASRGGKSTEMQALAAYALKNKHPALAGKTVFYWNMALLMTQEPGMAGGHKLEIFANIKRKIGRHADKVVLIFDEFQSVSMGNPAIAEGLKDYFGPNAYFKHVITSTTDGEYLQHIATNEPMDNRFEKMSLPAMEREKTKTILRISFKEENLPFTCSDRMLDKILDGCAGQPQPYTALSVLKDCIQQLKEKLFLQKEEEDFYKIQGRIDNLKKLKSMETNIDSATYKSIDHLIKELEKGKQGQSAEFDTLQSQITSAKIAKTVPDNNNNHTNERIKQLRTNAGEVNHSLYTMELNLKEQQNLQDQLIQGQKCLERLTNEKHNRVLKDKKTLTPHYANLALLETVLQDVINRKLGDMGIDAEIPEDIVEKALANLAKKIEDKARNKQKIHNKDAVVNIDG